MIYLDNNATTRVADEVLAAMQPYYREFYGNPHSAHALGRAAHHGIETARAEVASLLGAQPEEIFFTSCGTESNALVIRGVLRGSTRRKVVTSAVEHPSVLALFRELESEGRIDLSVIGMKESGAIDLDALEAAVDPDTLLVSIMLAQNEIGVLYPIERISALARRHGALVLCDAVQAAGKVAIDVRALDVDFLTISGHKFHAPKGVGALYVRESISVDPLWRGGNQEHGLRSGTEGVPQIVGLGVAARMAVEKLATMDSVEALRDRFEREILAGAEGSAVNGVEPRLPNTSSIGFGGLLSDALVNAFDANGLCTSAGAACHSGRVEPSAVMKALDRPRSLALGTVRFSLSRETTSAEIDEAIQIVLTTVEQLHARELQQRPALQQS